MEFPLPFPLVLTRTILGPTGRCTAPSGPVQRPKFVTWSSAWQVILLVQVQVQSSSSPFSALRAGAWPYGPVQRPKSVSWLVQVQVQSALAGPSLAGGCQVGALLTLIQVSELGSSAVWCTTGPGKQCSTISARPYGPVHYWTVLVH